MSRLNTIVRQMLEEHEGGYVFFDNLDEAIRNDEYLLDYFLDNYVTPKIEFSDFNIIMSGRFGRAMVNSTNIKYNCDEYYICDCILVNGSLRKGDKVEDFKVYPSKKFIFLDDSFYSGKTRDAIKSKLESYGCELVETIVLYDGSKIKEDTVTSMYRYYE